MKFYDKELFKASNSIKTAIYMIIIFFFFLNIFIIRDLIRIRLMSISYKY